MALLHNPRPPKHFFPKIQNHDINININVSFAHPQTAKAMFPNFKIVQELIQDFEAWGTEVSFMLGEPGTGAGGTGPPVMAEPAARATPTDVSS